MTQILIIYLPTGWSRKATTEVRGGTSANVPNQQQPYWAGNDTQRRTQHDNETTQQQPHNLRKEAT
ncbi:hypothetical protein MCC01968_06520 [Bifidobacteriaceae bacterium MCC01968]|nr:hypothetical protein MCC01961_15980 [Bifidobacteriaceae bacterium MCC01961]GDZ69110.1 hypothetical protein MCC02039_01540 [Bifidobacteriaceae bacterium MCC02039]GDZ81445.1 hypothetical protein MCC01968_06520 [Bifidobacteriaceae bacterium MCC01968]